MNPFQILALGVVALLFLLSAVLFVKGWATRRDAILWMLLWIAAGVAIVWPGVTKIVANALGIGRGADLLLYCTFVAMMVGFLMVYARLRRLRRELTLLVRHLAITNAAVNTSPPSPEDSPQTSGSDNAQANEA